MKKRLLAHVCCAGCARQAIASLKNRFDLSIFFYNPRLHSAPERKKVMAGISRLAKDEGVSLIKESPLPKDWKDDIMSVEPVAQLYVRCLACIDHTLDISARAAEKNGMDFFASTLSLQDSSADVIADEKSLKYNIPYLCLGSVVQDENDVSHSACSCRFSGTQKVNSSI